MIKTGTITQKQSALINGLTQNVGDFNKEMAKTPWGQLQMQQNISTEKYFKLGKHMVILKIEFQKLFNAIFPLLEFIMRVGGAVLGILSWITNKIIDVMSWVTKFSENNVDGMNEWRLAILSVGGVLMATFAPVLTLFGLVALAIEDIWVYMSGGESVIGLVIDWFKDLPNKIGGSIKDFSDKIGEFIDGIAEKTILKLAEPLQKVTEWFADLINVITEKYNAFISKIASIKSMLPFMGDSNVNVNNSPTIDPVLPTADLSDGNNTPSSILNNNGKSVRLELKMESGAIQQNFQDKGYLTLEDIQDATTQSIENLLNNGFLELAIQEGIVQ